MSSICCLCFDILWNKSFLMNNKCKYTLGKKLPEYPAQEEEVLLLEERVGEAKRLAVMVKFYIELS